jgi:L-lactate dehydrogenase
MLHGQYGIDGIYLSLPCLVGAAGVLRILTPALAADEQAALLASADVLRQTLQAAADPLGAGFRPALLMGSPAP